MPDDPIHVAAAAICDPRGRVLLARRRPDTHQGGLWEFPGGKLEPGEDVNGALVRELEEELGLTPLGYRPLIRVAHDYGDKRVLLDVWRVDAWRGEPHGREGQPVEWVALGDLSARAFPAANLPVVKALGLPETYLITPEPGADRALFLAALERALVAGVGLVQLRARSLEPMDYRRLATDCLGLCRRHGARLLLNAEPSLAEALGAHGVHLSARRLMASQTRPLPAGLLVGASCHGLGELLHAGRLGLDFALVSPVLATASHPGAQPLGWPRLRELTEAAGLPVYALGGMTRGHLTSAWAHGAQGIAAIRGLWPS